MATGAWFGGDSQCHYSYTMLVALYHRGAAVIVPCITRDAEHIILTLYCSMLIRGCYVTAYHRLALAWMAWHNFASSSLLHTTERHILCSETRDY